MATVIKYTRFEQSSLRTNAAAQAVIVPAETVTLPRTLETQIVRRDHLHPLVIMLLISIAVPVYFNIGPLRLSPNRLILLIAFFPATLRWLSGASGPWRTADFCVIGLCIWSTIAMFVSAGVTTIQYSGITIVETFGSYMIGRAYIRTKHQYTTAIHLLGTIVVLLVPGAIIESLTGFRVYNKLFDPLFSTFRWSGYEPRMHLFRAQAVFEHSILFGVFTAFCFAPILANMRTKAGRAKAWIQSSPIIAATFFSLSTGAYLGLMVQLFLMLWGATFGKMRYRWWLLGILVVVGYVVVDAMSNRTPFQVFSSYVVFDEHNAYWRVLIFRFGMNNVWESPFFGLGAFVNEWKRPEFMVTSTVDNFWLVFALTYGIPGFLLIFGTYIAVLNGLVRAQLTDPLLQRHREALCFSFIGVGIAIGTVHLWNATFVFIMFMMGAAAWLSDVKAKDQLSPDAVAAPDGIARRVSDRTWLTARRPPAR